MSLYLCNGYSCEPNVNCAIHYPGIGECHLTQNMDYASRPVITYYKIVEIDKVCNAITFLADAIGVDAKRVIAEMGFGSSVEYGVWLYDYCEQNGYSYEIVMARHLNDVAEKAGVPFRFIPKQYKKKKKGA